ncbi:MAG: CehA/McbA family metallohydrolase [Spirochaetes bacterium]|nr:CehA/McbA family metallohydrolase [Spirochaetota bacterium]
MKIKIIYLTLFFSIIISCTLGYINSKSSSSSNQIGYDELINADIVKGSITSFNYYYGTLHNHSNVSDGTGTPQNAYVYARDTGKLDFFGLADHAGMISSTEWTDIKNQANTYNNDGAYVTFYGFEWSHSTYGHVAVINSSDYCSESSSITNTFSKLLTWLSSRDCAAFFNHPGRQDSTGVEFNHFSDPPSNKFVGMELFNKGDGFAEYYYNDGYYSNDGNLGYYDEVLIRDWRIGAAGSDDNHKGTFGTAYPYRLCILSTLLTRSALFEGLKAKRFFTTADKNLKLYFEINGSVMGSEINSGSYTAFIQMADFDNEVFTKAELLKNGLVIMVWNMNDTNPTLTYDVTGVSGDYFYVRVKQSDGDEAISSPVFIASSSSGSFSSFFSSSSSSASNTVLEKRISSGADDAEERTNGSMYLNSTDLELVYDSGNQKVGMRFTDITIPKQAVIKSAYIQFKTDETASGTTSLVIKAHSIDNSTTFTSTTSDITNRTLTTAGVSWSPAVWSTVGLAGESQRTPDIKNVIQEIINRDGWASGNSISIIITGAGERVAEAYEGDSAGAPLLHIEY